jgi:hypothetical protein
MFRKALVVAVAVVGLGLIGAKPALADSSLCTPSGCAGKATFASYGEILTVYDQTGDGHSAVGLYWLQGGSGPFYVWAASGAGTSTRSDLELPEGSWIYYQVCLGEYGSKTLVSGTCSAGVTDYA